MSRDLADEPLEAVRSRYGDVFVSFAAHAALPVVLNPELIHLLRVNYFLDPPEQLPYTAEASLIFSPLCDEIDEATYVMAPELRDKLLEHLVAEHGIQRLRDVAGMLWEYGLRGTPWDSRPGLAEAQQLTAMNFLDPVAAESWLSEAEAARRGEAADDRWFVALRRELADRAAAVARAEQPILPVLAELAISLTALLPDPNDALLAGTGPMPTSELSWTTILNAAWREGRIREVFRSISRLDGAPGVMPLRDAVRAFWIRLRPALLIDDLVNDPPAGWEDLSRAPATVSAAAQALCRVEPGGALGFAVAPRAVLSLGVHALRTADFGSGRMSVRVDINVSNIPGLRVASFAPDVGFLPKPLPIVPAEPPDLVGRRVFVLGPSPEHDDADLVLEGAPMGYRVQPGEIIGVRGDRLIHDCLAVPSNRGSPVVDIATGQVLGIHLNSEAANAWDGISASEALILNATMVADLTQQVDPIPAFGQELADPGTWTNPFAMHGVADPDLYVDVGGSGRAFHEFQSTVRTAKDVAKGFFVVVHGRGGTGKSTLIHRCIQYLQQVLAGEGRRFVTLDLGRRPLSPSRSISERIDLILDWIAYELDAEGIIELDDNADAARRHASLSRMHLGDVTAIIRLPPSDDLTIELGQLARLAGPNVVMFGETFYSGVELEDALYRSRVPTLLLELLPLTPGDALLFVEDRLGRAGPGAVPPLEAGTIERVVNARETTVADLQRLLHDVYEYMHNRETSRSEITYDNITDYYFRRASVHRED
ncbi:hypothetical protein [Actinoplanes solisilvae]|uniref:hypothetical protein n=1 Tax=Actinoplanes solisilvae TaxID=2486853 RepID=UPI000FDAFBF6|nr:hypothetical protein [Actinoplanes solisilvae]